MGTSQSSAVAVVPAPPRHIEKAAELAPFVTNKAKALLEPMLKPLGLEYEQLLSELYFAIQKAPALAKCTPESLLQSAHRILSWGLTIGEKAYLVPFGTEATAVMDYKGAIDLVVRAGGARYIDAQCVFANEPFAYEQGTSAFIKHQPIMSPAKRGPLIGAYAVAKISGQDVKIIVLSREEIDAVRQKHSKQWKSGKLDDLLWYCQKTCVRRIVKQLPMNARMAIVAKAFEDEHAQIENGLRAQDRIESGTPPAAEVEQDISHMVEETQGDDGFKF